MTSYIKMATVQEKAMCVIRFFETKSGIKKRSRYRVSGKFTGKGLGYGLEERGIRVRPRAGAKIYILSTEYRQILGPS
jgi:hypothetical protein